MRNGKSNKILKTLVLTSVFGAGPTSAFDLKDIVNIDLGKSVGLTAKGDIARIYQAVSISNGDVASAKAIEEIEENIWDPIKASHSQKAKASRNKSFARNVQRNSHIRSSQASQNFSHNFGHGVPSPTYHNNNTTVIFVDTGRYSDTSSYNSNYHYSIPADNSRVGETTGVITDL